MKDEKPASTNNTTNSIDTTNAKTEHPKTAWAPPNLSPMSNSSQIDRNREVSHTQLVRDSYDKDNKRRYEDD